MAILIETKSYADNSKEREAAQLLKNCFSEELKGSKANGRILIASSVQIFGQEVRDIDLVVIGSLSGFKLNLNTKQVHGKKRMLCQNLVLNTLDQEQPSLMVVSHSTGLMQKLSKQL